MDKNLIMLEAKKNLQDVSSFIFVIYLHRRFTKQTENFLSDYATKCNRFTKVMKTH